MIRTYAILALGFLFVNPVSADEKWKWSDEKASIMFYFMRSSSNYQTHLVRRSMANWREVQVKISNGKETLFQWKTHREGAFVFSDSVVIYAKFDSISTGCEIRAYDLEQQKEIWRKPLQGIGMIGHSKYRNRINLEMRGKEVVIYGNESGGQYVEVLNVKTGEQKSNTVGRGKYKRFESKK